MIEKVVGVSGATIFVASDVAAKSAPEGPARDRLHAQWRLMRRIGSEAFPRVITDTPAGYIMERLEPLEWTPERCEGGVFQEATDVLSGYVWGRTRLVRFADVAGRAHREYVAHRVGEWAPHLREWFEQAYASVADARVTAVDDTHGDPTVENMMQRPNGDLVLIDPLPATQSIPRLLAVDLGKMLQSADGYERVKNGAAFPLKPGLHDRVLDGHRTADKWAAHYFHSVHVLRLIPYQTTERLRRVFIERLTEAAGAHA